MIDFTINFTPICKWQIVQIEILRYCFDHLHSGSELFSEIKEPPFVWGQKNRKQPSAVPEAHTSEGYIFFIHFDILFHSVGSWVRTTRSGPRFS